MSTDSVSRYFRAIVVVGASLAVLSEGCSSASSDGPESKGSSVDDTDAGSAQADASSVDGSASKPAPTTTSTPTATTPPTSSPPPGPAPTSTFPGW